MTASELRIGQNVILNLKADDGITETARVNSITETRYNFILNRKVSIGTTGRYSNKFYITKKSVERWNIELK